MKKELFLLMELLFMTFTVALYGGVDESDVTVKAIHNTSKFYVTFSENVEPQDVIIKIKNQSGQLLYSDIIITDRATKVYDMVEHGKGKYKVELQGIDFKFTKTVNIGLKKGFDAQMVHKNKRLELVYLSRSEQLDLYIKDQKGRILYQDQGKLGRYQKAFDLSNLPAGQYSLKLTNGEETFERFFEVQD